MPIKTRFAQRLFRDIEAPRIGICRYARRALRHGHNALRLFAPVAQIRLWGYGYLRHGRKYAYAGRLLRPAVAIRRPFWATMIAPF